MVDQETCRMKNRPREGQNDRYNEPLDDLASVPNDNLREEMIPELHSSATSDDESQLVPSDFLSEEIIPEQNSTSASGDKTQFAEWPVKTEEVLVSDYLPESEPGSDATANLWDEHLTNQDGPSKNPSSEASPNVKSRSCALCSKIFLNKRALTKHVKSRCFKIIFDPLKIPVSQPAAEVRRKNHNRSTSDEVPLSSKEVGQKPATGKRASFQRPRREKKLSRTPKQPTVELNNVNNWTCYVCNKSFPDQRKKNQHLRTHGVKSYACSICKKTFSWARDLRHHAAIHSTEKSFECKRCAEKFTTFGRLKWHSMNHDDEGPVECEVCKKTFRNKLAIRRHMVVHETVKKHVCDLCGARFRTKRNKQMHAASVHGSRVKKFECAECGKQYALFDYLRRHIICHSYDKKPTCDECGKEFTTTKSKNRHMLTHTGAKCLNCKVCDKIFLHVTYLRRHMRAVHPADKKYECTMCTKKFAAPQYLKQHLLVHSGAKDFECEICHKLFNNRSNRNKHVQSHEKPRKCVSMLSETVFSVM